MLMYILVDFETFSCRRLMTHALGPYNVAQKLGYISVMAVMAYEWVHRALYPPVEVLNYNKTNDISVAARFQVLFRADMSM